MVIGIDEAGRGPIAGPVSVCALRILEDPRIFAKNDLRDSKKLTEKRREEVFSKIQVAAEERKLKYAVSSVSPSMVDDMGITAALRFAVGEALEKVKAGQSEQILLDGSLKAPERYSNQKTIIKGDETELSIALASIVAKVIRDEKMRSLAMEFPEYGFDRHKGYGTKAHLEAVAKWGITPAHRRSFCKNLTFQDNQTL